MSIEIPTVLKYAKIIPSLAHLSSNQQQILLIQTQYKDYIVFAHPRGYGSSELICLFEKEKDAINFKLCWSKAVELIVSSEDRATLKIWDITNSFSIQITI